MDPLTILGTLKMGLAAGKSVHSLSKEIGAFFDSVDGAKKKHQKKKEQAHKEQLENFYKSQESYLDQRHLYFYLDTHQNF